MQTEEMIKPLLVASLQKSVLKNKRILFEILLRIAKANSYFAEQLKRTLENGLRFSAAEQSDQEELVAYYSPGSKTINVQHFLLKEATRLPYMNASLEMLFRHEVTHADDFKSFGSSAVQPSETMLQTKYFINDIFNFLHRGFSVQHIEPNKLDYLNMLLGCNAYDYINKGGISPVGAHEVKPLGDAMSEIIQCSGVLADSAVSDPGLRVSFIIDIKPIGDCLAMFIDYNLLSITDIYERAISQCPSGETRSQASDLFTKHFNSSMVATWKPLNKPQQTVLNLLILIYNRVLSNVAFDPLCKPELDRCSSHWEQNCITHFIECQKSHPSGPEILRDYLVSLSEIHAVLAEHACVNNTDIFKFDLVETPTPIEIHTESPKVKVSADHFPVGFYFSFITSFSSTLASQLIAHLDISQLKRRLLVDVFSAGIFYIMGLSFSNIALLKIANCIVYLCKEHLQVPFVLEATVASSLLFNEDRPQEMALSFFASSAGFFAAKKISRLLLTEPGSQPDCSR